MGLSDVVFGDRDFSEVDELIVLEDDVPWVFSVKKAKHQYFVNCESAHQISFGIVTKSIRKTLKEINEKSR